MRITYLFVPVLAVMAMATAGCQQNSKPDKAVTAEQWNGARTGVLLNLAREQYANGDFDKCRQTVDDALKYSPRNPEAHVVSARLYIERGELEVAQRELKIAGESDAKNGEVDYLNGIVYQRWQKPEIACECYTAACQKAPAELAYLLARAEMLTALDQGDQALSILQDKVVYFEHSGAIRDAVGLLLVQQKRYAEACDTFRQALLVSPDDQTIREHLSLALFYSRQYRDCQTTLARLLSDQAFAERADLMTMLGECDFELGQYGDARRQFDEASKHDSSSTGVWLGLAKSSLKLNDAPRVEMAIKKALALNEDYAEAHLLLGYLRVHQGRLDDALVEFLSVNAHDRTDTLSLCMVGYVLEKQGHADQALRYYGQALNLKPGDELATRLMASVNLRE